VPIVGLFIGGPLGAYVYDTFVGNFHAEAKREVGETVEDPTTGRPVGTRPEAT